MNILYHSLLPILRMSENSQTPIFPMYLAKSGYQQAISICPKGCQAQGQSFQGGLEGTVGSSLGRGEGKGNSLLGLGGEGERPKERVGAVQEWSVWVTRPDSPGLPQTREGHTSSVAG